MKGLFPPTVRPYRDIESFSVVIGPSRPGFQHLGVILRDPEDDNLRFFHLAWHHTLREEPIDNRNDLLWGEIPLPVERKEDLAVKAWLVRNSYLDNRIPYGFCAPNGFFDATTGRMILGPNQTGLTCATFVLALFHMAGVQLIDYASWEARPADVEFQRYVVQQLAGHADIEYINKVQGEVDGFRYRPEEVMASSITPLNVIQMTQLIPLGIEVVGVLSDYLAQISANN
jgi:hypothetical protein